jgi:hypothetical protein
MSIQVSQTFFLNSNWLIWSIKYNKDITGFQIKIDEQTHGIKICGWHNTVFNSKNDISVATYKLFILSILFSQLSFSHSILS